MSGNARGSGERSRRSGAPHHLLLLAGEIFSGDGSLVFIARFQALPVGGDVRPEILGKSNVFGKPQRVADDDIGRGDPPGDQRLRSSGRSFHRAQPPQKPFGVVGGDLRIAPLLGLELAVTQHRVCGKVSVASLKYIQFRNAP